jgi:hypothetical protein
LTGGNQKRRGAIVLGGIDVRLGRQQQLSAYP